MPDEYFDRLFVLTARLTDHRGSERVDRRALRLLLTFAEITAGAGFVQFWTTFVHLLCTNQARVIKSLKTNNVLYMS